MKLTDPTEDQINAAVAEHVAGYSFYGLAKMWIEDANQPAGFSPIPRFTRSADAVLPLLEKDGECEISSPDPATPHWTVKYSSYHNGCGFYGEGKTFPLAACIALLRAKGIQVEFTK